MLTPHRLKLTEISTTREMGVSNITANLQVTFFPTIYTQNSINIKWRSVYLVDLIRISNTCLSAFSFKSITNLIQ